jgi:hypothetical protein
MRELDTFAIEVFDRGLRELLRASSGEFKAAQKGGSFGRCGIDEARSLSRSEEDGGLGLVVVR